ncbi:putative T7SS-secreted protein [Nocardioides pacificus]
MSAPASKELGATENPKELVPGKPRHVDNAAEAFSDESARITRIGSRVRSIRVDGWSGGTGQPAWEANFNDELKKWSAYTDLLDAAASALTTYSGALTKAQDDAQDAIDAYEEGQRLTRRAVLAHNEAVAAYNDSVCAPVPAQSPFGTATPTIRPARPGPFVDPGEAKREEAQEILAGARKDLDEAGEKALLALGKLEGAKTQGSRDTFGADGSVEGPSFSWDWWERTFGKDPADGHGPSTGDEKGSPFKISLGKAEGEAYVGRAEGSWEDYWGPVKVGADGSVTGLGVDGSAEASVDGDGLRVNADGTVTVVGGEGSVSAEYGYAEGSVSGDFLVGGKAEGEVSVGKEGFHGGGELFAGGKVGGTAEGDIGGIGGSATAEGWAGAGISADVDLGWDDGKLTVGGSGGVAWGLGGKLGAEVTLDFPEIWETGGGIIDGLGSLLR